MVLINKTRAGQREEGVTPEYVRRIVRHPQIEWSRCKPDWSSGNPCLSSGGITRDKLQHANCKLGPGYQWSSLSIRGGGAVTQA